jgi:hypothetical protein
MRVALALRLQLALSRSSVSGSLNEYLSTASCLRKGSSRGELSMGIELKDHAVGSSYDEMYTSFAT